MLNNILVFIGSIIFTTSIVIFMNQFYYSDYKTIKPAVSITLFVVGLLILGILFIRVGI
jgi:hypothetical protein